MQASLCAMTVALKKSTVMTRCLLLWHLSSSVDAAKRHHQLLLNSIFWKTARPVEKERALVEFPGI